VGPLQSHACSRNSSQLECAADSLLGNDRQIIEPALRAAASRLNFCRYWELRRILHTLDVADSRGLGIALRNRVAAVAKSCLARLQLLQPVGAVRTIAVLRNRQSCASPVAKIGERSFLLRGFPHRQSVAYANFDRASMATVYECACRSRIGALSPMLSH
jgi:hypothetical protein